MTVIQNVSAFQVNPAVRAKFRYPSSNPTPNEIEDDRTDAQKVDKARGTENMESDSREGHY